METKEIYMEDLLNLMDSNILRDCMIEITNKCPFLCDHCYVDNAEIKKLDLDQFNNIIDQLITLKCNSILITGGEPLLHPQFCDMYVYAKERGFFVSINSNLFYLNDKIKKLFLKYKPDLIEISLYGYDDESYYNFTHVKNSYNNVIKNLDFLYNNNINFNLKTTLTTKNYYYLDELEKISLKYNKEFRYDYLVFPSFNSDKTYKPNPYRLKPEQIVEILKKPNNKTIFEKQFKQKLNEMIRRINQ